MAWFRDGVAVNDSLTRITILDNGWKLQIEETEISDATRYSCKATNIAGDAEKYYDLNVLGRFPGLWMASICYIIKSSSSRVSK